MKDKKIVIAIYKPAAGKEKELDALVAKHVPTLRELGLATSRESVQMRAADGAVVEIFEWTSEEAARQAHDHPAVAKIWESMGKIAGFGKLQDLPESGKAFAHFSPISL